MKNIIYLFIVLFFACNSQKEETPSSPFVMVLGIAQDAGYPQMNCKKECCTATWSNTELQRTTSCLAIVDPTTNEQWIIDATPNIKEQLQLLKSKTGTEKLDGVLLTHAHMGHYTGLMHFGREVMGTDNLPVFAMPKMKTFLEENGPWSQLVKLENINIKALKSDSTFSLNERIKIKPFLVPHRDEFSETVGYEITINNKSLIFIPSRFYGLESMFNYFAFLYIGYELDTWGYKLGTSYLNKAFEIRKLRTSLRSKLKISVPHSLCSP